ncbi:MAG: hypothetical protein Q9166_000953 [cf. Caloplaca sp. 2 TL-2023]
MAGLHVTNLKLTDMRMVVFGSGSAGTGIADLVRDAIATDSGKPEENAAKQIWCVDKPGLLKSQNEDLTPGQHPFAGITTNGRAKIIRTSIPLSKK